MLPILRVISSARALSLLAAIAVASQGLASNGAVLVCRWTGQVVTPDRCPTRSARDAQAPSVKTDSCCELRSAPPTPGPAAPSDPAASSPSGPLVIALAPPPAVRPAAASEALLLGPSRNHDPPRTPLYLGIRSLLL